MSQLTSEHRLTFKHTDDYIKGILDAKQAEQKNGPQVEQEGGPQAVLKENVLRPKYNERNPNVQQEAGRYIDALKDAAIDFVNSQEEGIHRDTQAAIEICAKKYKKKLASLNLSANIEQAVDSPQNKRFKKALDKADKLLREFTTVMCKLTGATAKQLDWAGHQKRSQTSRETIAYTWEEKGKSHFVIYAPATHFTQAQLEAKKGYSDGEALVNDEIVLEGGVEDVHDKEQKHRSTDQKAPNPTDQFQLQENNNTSHMKKKGTIGLTNCVRVIAGTRDEKGAIEVIHDSITVGSRLPHGDLPKVDVGQDTYAKLATQAITVMNQQEMIQAMAQQRISQLTNKELYQAISQAHVQENKGVALGGSGVPEKKEAVLSAETPREQLIEAYCNAGLLSVHEFYTQVVSPGQWFAVTERQREQHQYTQLAMTLFDREFKIPVHIHTGAGTNIQANAHYQGSIGGFGVNDYRGWQTKEQLAGNKHFINELIDQSVVNIGHERTLLDNKELGDTAKVLDGAINLLKDINNPPQDKNYIQAKINIERIQRTLSRTRSRYRETLSEYYGLYQQWKKEKSPKVRSLMDEKITQLNEGKATLETHQARLHEQHAIIEGVRSKAFGEKRTALSVVLKALRSEIKSKPELAAKKQLCALYNTMAYLADIQDLYYNGTWKDAENNLKLQALSIRLAHTIDAQSSTGCKSNNDRGQKTMEKTLETAFATAFDQDGLYNSKQWQAGKRAQHLLIPQVCHHQINTGVGGGKFKGDGAGHYGHWWGKIASRWGKPASVQLGFSYHLLNDWKGESKKTLGVSVLGLGGGFAMAAFFGPGSEFLPKLLGLGATSMAVEAAIFMAAMTATYLIGRLCVARVQTAWSSHKVSEMVGEIQSEPSPPLLQGTRNLVVEHTVSFDAAPLYAQGPLARQSSAQVSKTPTPPVTPATSSEASAQVPTTPTPPPPAASFVSAPAPAPAPDLDPTTPAVPLTPASVSTVVFGSAGA